MPIRQELDPATRIFRTTASGAVTLEDVRRHILTVRQVHATAYPELIDARQVTQVSLKSKDLLQIAHMAKDLLGGSHPQPRAIVVGHDDHFGIARMAASLMAGWMAMGVFEDPADAEAWLVRQSRRDAT